MDDEQLLALKKTGGVIQVVAYGGFVKTTKPDSPERSAALAAARREFNLPELNRPGPTRALPIRAKELSGRAPR